MRPRRRHDAWLLGLLTLVGCSLGCRTEAMDLNTYEQGNPYQRYSFAEVKQRAATIRAGMPRLEVLVRLGSPAENRGDTWLYFPERPNLLLPDEYLEVKFDGDVYVAHRFLPILLGERVSDP